MKKLRKQLQQICKLVLLIIGMMIVVNGQDTPATPWTVPAYLQTIEQAMHARNATGILDLQADLLLEKNHSKLNSALQTVLAQDAPADARNLRSHSLFTNLATHLQSLSLEQSAKIVADDLLDQLALLNTYTVPASTYSDQQIRYINYHLWQRYRYHSKESMLFHLYLNKLTDTQQIYLLSNELIICIMEQRSSSSYFFSLLYTFQKHDSLSTLANLYKPLSAELQHCSNISQLDLLKLICNIAIAKEPKVLVDFLHSDNDLFAEQASAMLLISADESIRQLIATQLETNPNNKLKQRYLKLLFHWSEFDISVLGPHIQQGNPQLIPFLMELCQDNIKVDLVLEHFVPHYSLLLPEQQYIINDLLKKNLAHQLSEAKNLFATTPATVNHQTLNSLLNLSTALAETCEIDPPQLPTLYLKRQEISSSLPGQSIAKLTDIDTLNEQIDTGYLRISLQKSYRLSHISLVNCISYQLSLTTSLAGKTQLQHKLTAPYVSDQGTVNIALNTSVDTVRFDFVGQQEANDIGEIILHYLPDDASLLNILQNWAKRELPDFSQDTGDLTGNVELMVDTWQESIMKLKNGKRFIDSNNFKWQNEKFKEQYHLLLQQLQPFATDSSNITLFQAFYEGVEGDANTAIKILKAAQAQNPYYAKLFYMQGLIEEKRLKKLDRAELSYKQSMQLNPYDLTCTYAYAVVLYKLKRYQECVDYLDHMLLAAKDGYADIHPYDINQRKSNALLHLKKYPEAIATLKPLLNPNARTNFYDDSLLAKVHYNLACAYSLNQASQAAIEHLVLANKYNPSKYNLKKINRDRDFNNIRQEKGYRDFLETLTGK